MSVNEKEMAQQMEYKMHASILEVPVLKGFQRVNDQEPQTVLLQTDGKGTSVHLASDGPMDKGETKQERIDLVIKNTIEFMKGQGLDTNGKVFSFVEKFKTKDFEYDIYVQDVVVTSIKQLVRSFNAYFVEPKFNDFYQVSLSFGPFDINKSPVKKGSTDFTNDVVSKTGYEAFKEFLKQIKYKK